MGEAELSILPAVGKLVVESRQGHLMAVYSLRLSRTYESLVQARAVLTRAGAHQIFQKQVSIMDIPQLHNYPIYP